MNPLKALRNRLSGQPERQDTQADGFARETASVIRRVREALDAQPGPPDEILTKIRAAAWRQQAGQGRVRDGRSNRRNWVPAAAAAALVLALAGIRMGLPRIQKPAVTVPDARRSVNYNTVANILVLLDEPHGWAEIGLSENVRWKAEHMAEWLLEFQGFEPAAHLTKPETPTSEPHARELPGHNIPGLADRRRV